MFCAVIVAAGSSRRAGFDKLAAPLAGVSVLRRSVDAFVAAGCACVVVVALSLSKSTAEKFFIALLMLRGKSFLFTKNLSV